MAILQIGDVDVDRVRNIRGEALDAYRARFVLDYAAEGKPCGLAHEMDGYLDGHLVVHGDFQKVNMREGASQGVAHHILEHHLPGLVALYIEVYKDIAAGASMQDLLELLVVYGQGYRSVHIWPVKHGP